MHTILSLLAPDPVAPFNAVRSTPSSGSDPVRVCGRLPSQRISHENLSLLQIHFCEGRAYQSWSSCCRQTDIQIFLQLRRARVASLGRTPGPARVAAARRQTARIVTRAARELREERMAGMMGAEAKMGEGGGAGVGGGAGDQVGGGGPERSRCARIATASHSSSESVDGSCCSRPAAGSTGVPSSCDGRSSSS